MPVAQIDNNKMQISRKDLVLSATVLILVISLSYFCTILIQKLLNYDEGNLLCLRLIPTVEISLFVLFSASLVLAFVLYLNNSGYKNEKIDDGKQAPDQDTPQDIKFFNTFLDLSNIHHREAQLWFCISLCIFLGGVIYAIFHSGSHLCAKEWGIHELPSYARWWVFMFNLLPHLFLYSLFFVSWRWAVAHFRAHWHDRVLNQYRYEALHALNKIRNLEINSEHSKDQAALLAAVFLLAPPDMPYLETEKTSTSAERILKIEELVRELITHREK